MTSKIQKTIMTFQNVTIHLIQRMMICMFL